MGRARRAATGRRLLAERDPGDQDAAIPASSSSPRRTGTSSGRSSSRASTTATTSASTTGSCTRTPSRSAGTSAADAGYQSKAPPLHREPRRAACGGDVPAREGAGRRGHDADPDRARGSSTRASSRVGAVRLPVFLARRPDEPPDADLRAFYERLLGRARRRRLPRAASGSSARRSGWDGNDTWREPRRLGLARRRPRKLVVVNLGDGSASGHVSLAVGRPARARLAARRRSRRASATSAAATTCATGCTSSSTPGRGTSST